MLTRTVKTSFKLFAAVRELDKVRKECKSTKLVPFREIAQLAGVSCVHASSIMRNFVASELLHSSPGRYGGYTVVSDPGIHQVMETVLGRKLTILEMQMLNNIGESIYVELLHPTSRYEVGFSETEPDSCPPNTN